MMFLSNHSIPAAEKERKTLENALHITVAAQIEDITETT